MTLVTACIPQGNDVKGTRSGDRPLPPIRQSSYVTQCFLVKSMIQRIKVVLLLQQGLMSHHGSYHQIKVKSQHALAPRDLRLELNIQMLYVICQSI